jgi:hypothetical protein
MEGTGRLTPAPSEHYKKRATPISTIPDRSGALNVSGYHETASQTACLMPLLVWW